MQVLNGPELKVPKVKYNTIVLNTNWYKIKLKYPKGAQCQELVA